MLFNNESGFQNNLFMIKAISCHSRKIEWIFFFPITLNDFFNTRQDIWLNKLTNNTEIMILI